MIDTKTKLAGLLGHPVGHSLSPLLQNSLAEHYGIKMAYLAFDVEEGKLKEAVEGAYALGAVGLNVTVPYKQEVRAFLAAEDEAAERIGAVNTLKREADGWHGYNTDMPGFLRALDYDGVEVAGKDVVLLGAGGAANAVLCALLSRSPRRLLLYNRTPEKAHKLMERILPAYPGAEAKVAETQEELLSAMKDGEEWIAVNTTSLGMAPDTERKLIEAGTFYGKVRTGIDIIFNPAETAFLKAVRETDPENRVYNGLRMLIFQGIRSFEIWNDLTVDDKTAESILHKAEEQLKTGGRQ